MSEFYFNAARITAAQICRSMGIERSSASVLDALTNIMLDFLTMLGTTAASASEGRCAKSADVSDAVLAAVQCGVVKARPNGDLNDNRDIEELIQWIRGSVQRRMADTARPQRVMNPSAVAPLPIVPPALSAESHGVQVAASSTEPSQAEDPSRIANDTGTNADSQPLMRPSMTAEPPQSVDWLQAAISRRSLMGHKDWIPESNVDPDPTIYGQ